MTTSAFVPLDPHRAHWKKRVRVGWITDTNGCDIWQGYRLKGYAMIGKQFVYRLRYEREIGPIPEGLELDHFQCDNGPRGCCNPRHCRPVTRRENMLRGNTVSAKNAAKTHCKRGHPLSGDNLVRAVRERGHRQCRQCKKEHDRAYALAHRKTIYARQRAWGMANRTRVSEYNRKWKRSRLSHASTSPDAIA